MNDQEKADLRQILADKAYQMGFEYEKAYGGCGQCTLLTLQDLFGRRNDDVFTALTGMAGGAGRLCDVGCGAYMGGVAFLQRAEGQVHR